ncbi:MAG TPA: phage baseplate assembly protein V [Candidatus Acidoferrum sp.]|nr:phage baseplate assembly protein V [Candidatus Acidoferrum sp.]
MPVGRDANADTARDKLETPALCTIRVDNKDMKATVSEVTLDQFIDSHHVLKVRIKQIGTSDASRDVVDFSQFTAMLGKSIFANIKPQGGMVDQAKELEFVGIITEVSLDNTIDGLNSALITGLSPTIGMDGARRNAFYYDQSASDIISAVIGKHPITPGTVDSTSGVLKFCAQYGETDYDFVRRMASSRGLFAHYDGKKFNACKAGGSASEELVWRQSLGAFSLGLGTAQKEFAGQAFDYVQKQTIAQDSKSLPSQVALSQLSKTSSDASANIYKGSSAFPAQVPVPDSKTLDQTLEFARNRHLGRMVRAQGSSIIPKIGVGQCIKIKGMGGLDGQYWLKAVHHVFDESGKYHNTFEASPMDLAFPEEVPFLPLFSHLQSGLVTDNKDPDGMGRIKIQLPWSPDGTTVWVRVLSPDAGDQRGWFSLPEINDEVLVGFEHGSPDHPIVLGCLYNGKDKPAVASGDQLDSSKVMTKQFKTRNGNEVTFTDKDGSEKIVITQKGGDNTITLSLNPKSITIESKGDITIKGDKLKIEGSSVDIQASGNASMKANGNLDLQAGANLAAKGSANCNVEGSAMTVIKGGLVQIN